MAMAGRIRCDFCGYIGEMEFGSGNKGILSTPDGWISIYPTVVISGLRGKLDQEKRKKREEIRDKVKEKVKTLHCCLGCATERDVFSLALALPSPQKKPEENFMKV